MTPLVAQNLDDKGEITEANKSIQRGLASEEEERRSQPEYGGTICPEQSDRNSIPTGTERWRMMSLITKLLEVKLEPAGQ